MFELNRLYNMDCLEGMKGIPDKSIDLIVTDPPYNIGKAKWDKIKNYADWMGVVFKECERVLKDNGSFYWFHNDVDVMAELILWLKHNTRFILKQFIVWNKKFNGAKNEGFLQGFNEVDGLRNYQKMAEYCLFYTFQDETGLTTIKLDMNNFPTLRQYFKDFQEALGLNKKQIMELIGQQADHCFRWGSSQWDMPTKETYVKLCNIPLKYEFVRKEYEFVRKEYEDLRYTFNNLKTHHSVWNYEVAEKIGHVTPKPLPLIENIIRHSSNENDIVLDCFMGSGTAAVACYNTNRNFIGFEISKEYCTIAQKRINEAKAQVSFFEKVY